MIDKNIKYVLVSSHGNDGMYIIHENSKEEIQGILKREFLDYTGLENVEDLYVYEGYFDTNEACYHDLDGFDYRWQIFEIK